MQNCGYELNTELMITNQAGKNSNSLSKEQTYNADSCTLYMTIKQHPCSRTACSSNALKILQPHKVQLTSHEVNLTACLPTYLARNTLSFGCVETLPLHTWP